MRTLAIMAVSAFALAAYPAMAQTGPGSAGPAHSPAVGGATSAPSAQKKPAVNPLSGEDVSQLNGTDVYGANDSKVGSVSTALMNPESKKIDRLVVSSGGVLGIGAHRVVIPLDQFKWQSDKGGFKIAQTEDQLKAMPEWRGKEASSASSAVSPPAHSGGGTTTSNAAPVEPNAPQSR